VQQRFLVGLRRGSQSDDFPQTQVVFQGSAEGLQQRCGEIFVFRREPFAGRRNQNQHAQQSTRRRQQPDQRGRRFRVRRQQTAGHVLCGVAGRQTPQALPAPGVLQLLQLAGNQSRPYSGRIAGFRRGGVGQRLDQASLPIDLPHDRAVQWRHFPEQTHDGRGGLRDFHVPADLLPDAEHPFLRRSGPPGLRLRDDGTT